MWNQLLPNMPLVGSAVVNRQLSGPGWSLASDLARVSQFIWHVGLPENWCTSETLWNGTHKAMWNHMNIMMKHEPTSQPLSQPCGLPVPSMHAFTGISDIWHGKSKVALCCQTIQGKLKPACDLSFYVFLGISWHLKSCKRRKPKGTPCSNSTNKPVPRIPQHSCPATRGLIGAPTRPISCYHAIDQWGLTTIGVPIEVDGLTEEDLWKPLTLLWLVIMVIFRW